MLSVLIRGEIGIGKTEHDTHAGVRCITARPDGLFDVTVAGPVPLAVDIIGIVPDFDAHGVDTRGFEETEESGVTEFLPALIIKPDTALADRLPGGEIKSAQETVRIHDPGDPLHVERRFRSDRRQGIDGGRQCVSGSIQGRQLGIGICRDALCRGEGGEERVITLGCIVIGIGSMAFGGGDQPGEPFPRLRELFGRDRNECVHRVVQIVHGAVQGRQTGSFIIRNRFGRRYGILQGGDTGRRIVAGIHGTDLGDAGAECRPRFLNGAGVDGLGHGEEIEISAAVGPQIDCDDQGVITGLGDRETAGVDPFPGVPVLSGRIDFSADPVRFPFFGDRDGDITDPRSDDVGGDGVDTGIVLYERDVLEEMKLGPRGSGAVEPHAGVAGIDFVRAADRIVVKTVILEPSIPQIGGILKIRIPEDPGEFLFVILCGGGIAEEFGRTVVREDFDRRSIRRLLLCQDIGLRFIRDLRFRQRIDPGIPGRGFLRQDISLCLLLRYLLCPDMQGQPRRGRAGDGKQGGKEHRKPANTVTTIKILHIIYIVTLMRIYYGIVPVSYQNVS